MKLHCFAGLWSKGPLTQQPQQPPEGWFNSTNQNPSSINVVQQQPTVNMNQQLYEDFRDIVKKKADRHSSYFRTLIGSSYEYALSGSEPDRQMAEVVGAEAQVKSESATMKRQRRQGVYERKSPLEGESLFKSVKQLRDEYKAMLRRATDGEVQQDDDRSSSTWHRKHKVTRCASSDSAICHSEEEEEEEEEVKDCSFYSPYSPRGSIDHSAVPSKIIIPAKTVLIDRKCSIDCVSEEVFDGAADSRRQSCFTDDDGEEGAPKYRYWRTPSVVVSDYSDDIMGLTLEDLEYIRSQRRKDSSSPESSLHSSCSNLNYCGSTISGLESDYVLTKPYRKSSNCSTCSTLSGDEEREREGTVSEDGSTLRPLGRVREVSDRKVIN